ncbi:MAG TPA: hypothetical protein EYG60_04275 [Campylobacterales bacterium]|nr:hypothetical protein [Campylobacterales bacterium]
MKIDSLFWSRETGWQFRKENIENRKNVDIVFLFGVAKEIRENLYFDGIRELYPNAILVGGSSAGTIYRDEIFDSGVVASALQLEKSRVKLAVATLEDISKSFEIGKNIVQQLMDEDLRHIVVLSDTININGSEFVKGLNSETDSKIPISGGILAEETRNFSHAYVIADRPAKKLLAIGIGFYGDIDTFYGSDSGWDDFGIERVITKSSGNIVYEIDGKPALDLYKKYLGDFQKDLPVGGLRFPLNVWEDGDIENSKPVIRTLMAINEEEKSLTFVGDVPEGAMARLMKTNIDGLIDGSENAIKMTGFQPSNIPSYCLAVSCIGRRLVLNQLTEEELSVLLEHVGDEVEITGFYSYGEIAPFSKELKNCRFHNQTMTLTLIQEK